MKLWLGIDCGGTFIKAGLYNQQGQEFGTVRQNLAVISGQAGWAERDLDNLWQACANVIQRLISAQKINPIQIQGVGISAQGKGLFLLDKQQKPLGRGILSSDQRALSIVRQWQKEGIPSKLYPLTRQTLWTGHPVSILYWIKQYQPERYQQIGTVFMAHDYLRFCLTGKLGCEVTNISESNLYHLQQGKYASQLAEWLDLEEIINALPPQVESAQIAGYISASAARLTGLIEGTPVVGGLFDVVSTALCADLRDESVLNVVLGTWTVVSGITQNLDFEHQYPFVYGRYADPEYFIVHDASPTSAANLEWFTQQWQELSYPQINQMVEALPKVSSKILFVPFLYGSNAGLGMTSAFYGLQALHHQGHLLQAIYEGVLFSLMTHLERLLQRFPSTKLLRVTGGPTRSRVWLQMLSDLTGLPLEIPQIDETGCLGAALAAMVGTNAYPTFSAAQTAIHCNKIRIEPDLSVYSKYLHKYQTYQRLIHYLQQYHQEILQLEQEMAER